MANETFEQFHRSFLNLAGVKNDNELWQQTTNQFKSYETKLKSGVAELNEDVSATILN